MKIAIPVEEKDLNTPVCPSFGRAPFFAIYDTEESKAVFIENGAAADQSGAGIKAAQIVADTGAKAVITPRCGENSAEILAAAGIELYKSVTGSVQNNIEAYLGKELEILKDIHKGFHGADFNAGNTPSDADSTANLSGSGMRNGAGAGYGAGRAGTGKGTGRCTGEGRGRKDGKGAGRGTGRRAGDR